MIDTHAHLYDEQFDDDREQMIIRALDTGVTHILMPNVDQASYPKMMALAKRYPKQLLPMIGLHPCSVSSDFSNDLNYLKEKLYAGEECFAVGEIGTDLFWDKSNWHNQKKAFETQCEWALEKSLPVVIHSRESIDQTIELIIPYAEKGLTGVFHCFTGSLEQANRIIGMGFYLGIGGVATFKNSSLPSVIKQIGLQNLLLETDAPYLAPVPFRGKRNEPAYLHKICEQIAAFLSVESKKVSEVTTINAKKLFRLQHS